MRCTWAAALLLAAATPVYPQSLVDYDMLYGPIADVTITDLVQGFGNYDGRGVRTKGRLDLAGLGNYRLAEGPFSVGIAPVNEIASAFQSDVMSWLGRDVEIVGVVRDMGATGLGSSGIFISFWRYEGPPPPRKGPLKANSQTLEALVIHPGQHDGETVRVVGKFRGKNLYGDLPSRSERSGGGFVIKDDLFAAWVVGKKPKGPGWDLDPNMKRDTGKWVEVAGRVETRDGITYIRALEVNLAKAPTSIAEAKAPPPPPPKPKLPPVVVFSLPLDGDAEVPSDSRFTVQFSKDMDVATFKGHIILRYKGPVLPGDRGFDGVKVTYDEGKRALTVDPGGLLRPGRKVDLILLPGIVDSDGLPLAPRSGEPSRDGAIDRLQYQIVS